MLVPPRSRMMLIAVLRQAAMTSGPWPVRTLEWSSPSVTLHAVQAVLDRPVRVDQSASTCRSASQCPREVITYTVSTDGLAWPARPRRRTTLIGGRRAGQPGLRRAVRVDDLDRAGLGSPVSGVPVA